MADFEDQDVMTVARVPQRGDLPNARSAVSSHLDRAPADHCLRAAETMFACYRRDQAANPEIYAAAIGAVLSEYPKLVVDVITDPRTGIQNRCDWPPTIKEMREACDTEAAKQWRAATATPKPNFNRPYVPPPNFPGCRANVFVRADAPQYPALKAWSESKDADHRDWKLDEKGRAGIHVSLLIFQNLGSRGRVASGQSPSEGELRASLARMASRMTPAEEETEAP